MPKGGEADAKETEEVVFLPRLYAVGTGGHGNESVTVMPQSIPSAKSARGRGCCGRWKKYTTGCRWQKK